MILGATMIAILIADPSYLWEKCAENATEATVLIPSVEFSRDHLINLARKSWPSTCNGAAKLRVLRFVTDERFEDISLRRSYHILPYSSFRKLAEAESRIAFDLAEIVMLGESRLLRLRAKGSRPMNLTLQGNNILRLSSGSLDAEIAWIAVGGGTALQYCPETGESIMVHVVCTGKPSLVEITALYAVLRSRFQGPIRATFSDTPWFPENGSPMPLVNPFFPPTEIPASNDNPTAMRYVCGSKGCTDYRIRAD